MHLIIDNICKKVSFRGQISLKFLFTITLCIQVSKSQNYMNYTYNFAKTQY